MRSDVERLLLWSANETAENFGEVVKGAERLQQWIFKDVVGNDVYPGKLPAEAQDAFNHMMEHFEKIKSVIDQHSELRLRLWGRLMQLKPPITAKNLSEQEYYLCRALGFLSIPQGFPSEYETHVLGSGEVPDPSSDV